MNGVSGFMDDMFFDLKISINICLKLKKMSKNVKCCMIGKQKVGKTRFFDTYFGKKINIYTPTIGVDFLKINNMVIWLSKIVVTVTRNFVLSSTVYFVYILILIPTHG